MNHVEKVDDLIGKVVKKAELNELMDEFKITFEDDTFVEISCECLKLFYNGERI